MKFNKIYIISWLGPTAKNLEKRKKVFARQLEWCKQVGLEPVVYAQEFSKEDYVPGVEYMVESKPLQPWNTARDIVMERFYNSDDDYAIIADDDAILYSGDPKYADGDGIVQVLKHIDIQKLKAVDLFYPIVPRHEPFSAFTLANASTLQTHLWFEASPRAKGSMYFLKNLKKHYNTPVYHGDPTVHYVNGVNVGGGDYLFAYQMIYQGFGVYRCKNIILNEMASAASTWVNNDTERAMYLTILENLVYTKFNVTKKDFMKAYFRYPKKLFIEKG